MTTFQDAARLLITHSVSAARELARRTPASPIYQQLYNRFASEVLGDESGDLTPAERAIIAEYVTFTDGQARDRRLQVRLTDAEYQQLQADARDAGMDMSGYVRSRLGLADALP